MQCIYTDKMNYKRRHFRKQKAVVYIAKYGKMRRKRAPFILLIKYRKTLTEALIFLPYTAKI